MLSHTQNLELNVTLAHPGRYTIEMRTKTFLRRGQVGVSRRATMVLPNFFACGLISDLLC